MWVRLEKIDLLISDIDIGSHITDILYEDREWLREIPSFQTVDILVVLLSEFSGESITSICGEEKDHTLYKENSNYQPQENKKIAWYHP